MKFGNKPLILFLILFSLGAFLVGIRYGQYITRFDQVYIPTPSPLPTYTPYPTQPPQDTQYSRFTHDECGVSFLYPDYLEVSRASLSATLSRGENERITINCQESVVREARDLFLDLSPMQEESLEGKDIPIYSSTDGSLLRWSLSHPQDTKSILFSSSPAFVPLLFETISFL